MLCYLITSTDTVGTLFVIVTFFVTLGKPYQRQYINYAEAFLLSLMTLLGYIIQSLGAVGMFETERILLASPVVVIILIHVRKFCDATIHALNFHGTSNLGLSFLEKCFNCFFYTAEPNVGSSADMLPETQTLIAPISH